MGRSSVRFERRWDAAILGVWVAGLATVFAASRAVGADDGSPDGVEVLTRGPVHEAFAVPVVNDPKPGLVAPKAPPEAVEEMPPDQKPAGQDVRWIPGYWSWDQDRGDFLWISGVWREPPPGRQWVPGYWNPVAGGVQWIPGAWIPVGGARPAADDGLALAQGEAAYLPEPPASLEVGPNIPQPSAEVFWSPGCWFWNQGRYVWRPGFWAAVQPAWVWVPAHYVWTPGGCLFVEGYWDLPLVNRGVLFAPVYYAQPVYLRPAYVYTPTITIAAPGLVANLFVQPTYHHYCFGDYYDRRFLTAGVYPWFSFTYASGPRPPAYYDPLFTFYASVNVRSNPRWASHCREEYVMRRDNIAMRPPQTYIEQTRIVQNNINITRNTTVINNNFDGGRPGPANVIGRPIEQVAMQRRDGDAPRLERIDPAARREWRDRSRQMTDFRVQRAGREVEAAPRPGAGPGARPQPRPFAMSPSPVAAPRVGRGTGATRAPEHVARPANPGANRPAPAPRPERGETPIARGPATPRPATDLPRNRANPAAPAQRPDMERIGPVAGSPPNRPNLAAPAPRPKMERMGVPAGLPRNRPDVTTAAPRPPMERKGLGANLAARPLPERPMREGAPTNLGMRRGPAAARAEAQPPAVRRPPPAPRPMGPAARRAAAAEGARPGPNP